MFAKFGTETLRYTLQVPGSGGSVQFHAVGDLPWKERANLLQQGTASHQGEVNKDMAFRFQNLGKSCFKC